jgi:hypothetical protein
VAGLCFESVLIFFQFGIKNLAVQKKIFLKKSLIHLEQVVLWWHYVVALCEVDRVDPPPRVHFYIETVVDLYSEIQFQENFRMNRQAFEKLQGLVANMYLH